MVYCYGIRKNDSTRTKRSKVNNRDNRAACEVFSKLKLNIEKRRHHCGSRVVYVNFEQNAYN